MSSSPLKIISSSLSNKKDQIQIENLDVWHKQMHIIQNLSLSFADKSLTCIIGPSGSGKSTLLRSINRINDEKNGFRYKGDILLDGSSVFSSEQDLTDLRSQVGMVFQKPCVFPKSILENVCFGLAHHKKLSKLDKLDIAEEYLKAAFLWKEVSHRLDQAANSLSIGQQQRLCIARTLAMKPRILLLDEPTSALDPSSTKAIEDLLLNLKENYTLVLVSHNIQQAKRVSDKLVFICAGQMMEAGDTVELFDKPKNPKTKAYLNDEVCDC